MKSCIFHVSKVETMGPWYGPILLEYAAWDTGGWGGVVLSNGSSTT